MDIHEQLIVRSPSILPGFLKSMGNTMYSWAVDSFQYFSSFIASQGKNKEITTIFSGVQRKIIETNEDSVKQFYKGCFETLLASEQEKLNKTEKAFQKIWGTDQYNLSVDQMVAFRQFSEMKDRWNREFDSLKNEMNGNDELRQIYSTENKLKNFIKNEKEIYSSLSNVQAHYQTQSEKNELKRETLKEYVSEHYENVKSQEPKFDRFSSWELLQYIRKFEHNFRPQIEEQLSENLKEIKSFSSWEECISHLGRYVESSLLLEGIQYFWENRENSDYESAVSNFVKDVGFKLYMDALEREKILPGNIELQALARKEGLHIRLYSYSENNPTDFGWNKQIPNLIFFENEKGVISQMK